MRVVVIGGGVSGLAAARLLADHGDVVLLEASRRLGGKLDSVTLEDVQLDVGAESVLARRPEAIALIDELGLRDRLVHPTDAKPALLIDGESRTLPPSVLGVPTSLAALSSILTEDGLARARQEPALEAPPLAGDEPVGELVDRRFGFEVTDRLLEPMLGGVYAGRARDLSFQAVASGLYERARHGGSLLSHAAATARDTAAGPVFAGLVGGLTTLVEALAADLARRGVQVRLGATARSLERASDGYQVVVGPTTAPEVVRADAVVLAAPAAPTGRLLADLVPVAQRWSEIPYASMAVITLVVRGIAPTSSGLLVPPGGLPTIKALTYSSEKWAWLADVAERRWGSRVAVVRASVGRMGEEGLLQLPDEALLQRTFAEAEGLPEWEGAHLVTGHVTRWGGGLPQYRVGHRDLVERLRSDLAAQPGLAVCGAAVDGVGIAACLGSAADAAKKLLDDAQAYRED